VTRFFNMRLHHSIAAGQFREALTVLNKDASEAERLARVEQSLDGALEA
jgi:hypothetical protein